MAVPYSPEVVAEWLGWSPAEVVERFGAYVLVDVRLGKVELRAGPPTREQMRARVAAIIAAAWQAEGGVDAEAIVAPYRAARP